MIQKSMPADRIGGGLAMVLGLVSIIEAIRLYPLRMSPFVGDHLMFGLLGGLLLLLGSLLAWVVEIPHYRVEYPAKKVLQIMLAVIGLLFAYRYTIPFLGYLPGTFIFSLLLFKVMGNKSWSKSFIFAVIFTAVIYGIFIFWLNTPLPKGIFHF